MKVIRAILLLGFVGSFIAVSMTTHAQLAWGTASGAKLVTDLAERQGTAKGTSQTEISFFSGEQVFPLAAARTFFGRNGAVADSRTGEMVALGTVEMGQSAYAASYYGDVFLFSGRRGAFSVSIGWTIEGAMWDENGSFSLLVGPNDWEFSYSDRGTSGSAWARWRTYYYSILDLNSLELQGANPADPVGGYVEEMFRNSDGGILTPSNVMETGNVVGIQFLWDYGVPLPIGSLLEVYAQGGAIAEFYNSGVLSYIEVPEGTVVQAASGTQYNIRYRPTGDPNNEVPEPSAMAMAAMFALVAGGIALRRRK